MAVTAARRATRTTPRRTVTRRPAERSPAGLLGSVIWLLLVLLARTYDAGRGIPAAAGEKPLSGSRASGAPRRARPAGEVEWTGESAAPPDERRRHRLPRHRGPAPRSRGARRSHDRRPGGEQQRGRPQHHHRPRAAPRDDDVRRRLRGPRSRRDAVRLRPRRPARASRPPCPTSWSRASTWAPTSAPT